MKTSYQFSEEKSIRLDLKTRILLFMVRRDLKCGRDGDVSDRYGDLKESIFLCSSAFLHFSDAVFHNVVYWDELKEYHGPDLREGQEPLPKGFVALAYSPASLSASFSRVLVNLVKDGMIYAFRSSFRALSGMGSRTAPLLQVWDSRNRDRSKDIVAVSLRDAGFEKAKAIDQHHKQICPWQLHEAIVADRQFAEQLSSKTT